MKKNTRELLLDSAFQTFYKQGFQGANIATILDDVGINKGSMYHYFKSKKELGLAVINERIEHNLITKYSTILESTDPLKELFYTLYSATESLAYGCPLNKMSQEMVYIDEDFKKMLSETYVMFQGLINKILEKENIPDSKTKARLIIATYEGALMVYHLNQDKSEYREVIGNLKKSFSCSTL